MRRPPLPPRIVSHVPTYRTIRALVPTDARSRFNRYEPAMTIATAANAFTPTPHDGHANPQYGHAVSRTRHNHYHGSHQYCRVGYTCSRVAHRQCRVGHKCFRVRPKLSHGGRRQCKGKHLASGSSYCIAIPYYIYIPFIKRVGWVVHCSLHGVIIGRESDTKSFVPFQGFALLRLRVVADIPESGLSDIRNHPPPRLPTGRLKRNKIKKPPSAVKKSPACAGTKSD